MGVSNVLCLTGDGVGTGDQPGAKSVFDFDSVSLLRTLRTMRDDGVFLSGRKIASPPHLFLGAAENPCVPPYEWRVDRLAKKVAAGADFIQANYVFDVPIFEKFMERVRDKGLDKNIFILAGGYPLASARAARCMRSNVPGIHIPDEIIARLEGATDQGAEGTQICIEMIQKILEIAGISGVHVMVCKREHTVSDIALRSGILQARRSC